MKKLILLFAFLALTACVRSEADTGVANTWREDGVSFEVGTSNQQDVLDALGPPSQIIPLHDQTVFYYLAEHISTRRMLLIIYNQNTRKLQYDRAIFFFDQEGVLSHQAMSQEAFE